MVGRVLAADPHNEMALRLRVVAQLRLNRAAEARADLDELLRLKPADIRSPARQLRLSVYVA